MVVKKIYDFMVERPTDFDVVLDLVNFISDVLRKNGYKVSCNMVYRRVKIEIEGGDGNESRS
jgi:hypothetical protein